MNRANVIPQMAYAHVACAVSRNAHPSLRPDMGEPGSTPAGAMRCFFQMLQAYRMPRHRLTAVPAAVTTHTRAGTDVGGFMWVRGGEVLCSRSESRPSPLEGE